MSQDPLRFFICYNFLMSKTILFIDGENFLHKIEDVLKKESKGQGFPETVNLDFNKLFSGALKGLDLSRKIFYGAKLHFNSETPKKSTQLIKAQRKLINNLKNQKFEFVMAGNVRGQKVGDKMIFREKGVDVKIAVDLVSWACEGKLKRAILCSSDSDLQPAIAELRKRKVEIIYLGFEMNPNKGLTFTTNRTILLRNSEVIEAIQRKDVKK